MNSVKIGHQEWSTNNLCVTHFRNGDPIQEVKNYDDWMNAINSNTPARMSYRKSKKKGEPMASFIIGMQLLISEVWLQLVIKYQVRMTGTN
jgi:urease accessory protein UreF